MGLGHLESEASASEARGLRKGIGGSRTETFSGFDTSGPWLGPVNYWAYSVRLIHDPIVTPQFPCLEDYGNFSVPEEWIKLSRHTLTPWH
jgi:hypothetical protein